MKIQFLALILAFAAACSAVRAEDSPVCHLQRVAYPDSFQVGVVPILKIGLVVFPQNVFSAEIGETGSISGDILHRYVSYKDRKVYVTVAKLPTELGDNVVVGAHSPNDKGH